MFESVAQISPKLRMRQLRGVPKPRCHKRRWRETSQGDRSKAGESPRVQEKSMF